MTDRHARAEETLEADTIEEAKILGEAILSGFKSSASIKFLDKNEFVNELAKTDYGGDQEVAYRDFMESGLSGFLDPLKNEAFYTLRECAPSYKTALRAAVHEVYGHEYINEMRAVKEGLELKKKMLRGEASKLETAKANLFGRIFQLADEGFAYWVNAKADKQMKSDRKHFAKYDQTRLDAWALLEHETPLRKTSDEPKEIYYDNSLGNTLFAYMVEASLGQAIYQEIEKKFGEKAVLSAAKACLDVPLDEIVSDEMAELHIASKNTQTPEAVMVRCSDYVKERLNAISGYSGPYPNDHADFEKMARELANGCEKPTPDIDENGYLGMEMTI